MANWIVMPVVNGLEMTRQAICDCLDQTGVDPHVLVVLQGADREIRETLEGWAEREPRLLVWSHDPPLPSLSATWNRALRFVWEAGGEEALVVNNDVRLHPETLWHLSDICRRHTALFVSAVGVREAQFNAFLALRGREVGEAVWDVPGECLTRGGPDFSCFLISQGCHWKYPFDEGFVPAYKEDCCYHREMMLGGDGARIFSVNLPYLHYASQTVQQMSPEERSAWAKRSGTSRAHYIRCWGGDVNEERFTRKGDPTSAREGVTNPDLQRRVLSDRSSRDEVLCDAPCSATPDSTDPRAAGSHPDDGIRSGLGAAAVPHTASTDRA